MRSFLILAFALFFSVPSLAQDTPPTSLALFDQWTASESGDGWTFWSDSLGNAALTTSRIDSIIGGVYASVNDSLWARADRRAPWYFVPDSVAAAFHVVTYADSSLRDPLDVLYALLRTRRDMPQPWFYDPRE